MNDQVRKSGFSSLKPVHPAKFYRPHHAVIHAVNNGERFIQCACFFIKLIKFIANLWGLTGSNRSLVVASNSSIPTALISTSILLGGGLTHFVDDHAGRHAGSAAEKIFSWKEGSCFGLKRN